MKSDMYKAITGKSSNVTRDSMYKAITGNDLAEKRKKRQEELLKAQQQAQTQDSLVDAGAFEDGYQPGDVVKTILGTGVDVAHQALKGVLGVGESIGDLAAYAGAQIVDWAGNKEYADQVRQAANESLTDKIFETYEKEVLDKNSVLGTGLKNVGKGLGQIGAFAATGGTSGLLGSATMFASGAGSAGNEAYSKENVTNGQAWAKILLGGGISLATEQFGGWFGKYGIDEAVGNALTKNLTSGAAKVFTRAGVKATSEAAEEFLEYAGNQLLDLGIDAASNGKGAKFHEDWNWEEVGEQMATAFITSSIASGAVDARNIGKSKGKNFSEKVNNYAKQQDIQAGQKTQNEKNLINIIVQERIDEAENNDEKVSKRQIKNEVIEDLENGDLNLDDIEKALGGEYYTKYQEVSSQYDELQTKIDELLDSKDLTERQRRELANLEEQIKKIDVKTAQSELSGYVNQLTQEDSFIRKSYDEYFKKGQAYQIDPDKKYSEKQLEQIQKAIDSGLINNTNQMHKLMDNIAQIHEDKDITFNFIDSKEATEHYIQNQINNYMNNNNISELSPQERQELYTRFKNQLNGRVINGFVENGEVYLNVDSAKYLNAVMGHEITHLFEGDSKLYKKLRKEVLEFAKTKGEYKERLAQIGENYKEVNSDLETELVNDIIGDYLFTDEEFVRKLSTNKNIFEKIYNEIKYLANVITGRKEQAQLQKVKNMFDKVYSEIEVNQNSGEYSIAGIKGINNLQDSKFKRDALNAYEEAQKLAEDNVKNEKIRQQTKWFKDKNGDWKFELDDSKISINNNLIQRNGKYKLGEIITHPMLFKLYPELKNYDVEFKNLNKANGSFNKNENLIEINNKFIRNSDYENLKGTILHEIQHAIQKIENFESGMNAKLSKKAYYEKLGEIEANDTKQRYLQGMDKETRESIAPESSKESPKHTKYNEYMSNRKTFDKIKDTIYPIFSRSVNNTKINNEELDNSSFKLSEIQGLEDYSRDEIKSIASDYIKTALLYSDVDADIKGMEIIGSRNRGNARADSDLDIVVEIDGEDLREDNLFNLLNDDEEPLEINGIRVDINPIVAERSGTLEEFMKRSNEYDKEVLNNTKYSISEDSQGRELSKQQQKYFKDSKVRDENGRLLEVYHGTENQFNEFKYGGGEHGKGFYFTDDYNYAEEFSDKGDWDEGSGRVINSYLKITNPLEMNVDFNSESMQKFMSEIESRWELTEQEIRDCFKTEDWSSELSSKVAEKMGYGIEDVESTVGFEIESPEDFGITDYNAYLGAYAWDNGLNQLARESGFDGIISRIYNSDAQGYEYIAFNSNQIKNIDNTNPTTNGDIRYSISVKEANTGVDSDGDRLTKGQQKYFANSKVTDSKGNLQVVYHGTQNYDFNEFEGGVFLTDDYMNADGYAAGERVIAAYVNIENPLVIDCEGRKWDNLDTPYGTSTREIVSSYDTKKYDGVIFENINDNWIDDEEAGYPATVYYVDNSNQVKNIDNENPTENPDIRYSISNTTGKLQENGKDVKLDASDIGTTGTLMAIHNLSEDKLNGILELGGFPVPSIAVTNPNLVDHNEFGKYSAIFKKDTIDPKNRKNEIYDRDVWSPTFPRIEYEANEKVLDDIRKSLKLDYKNEQDSIQRKAILDLYTDRIENLLDSGDLERVRDEIKNNKDIQYSYLKEKGLIEPIYKQVEYNSRFSNDMLKQFLEQYQGSTDFSWNTPLNELSYEQTMALGKTIQRIVKPFYDEEINRIKNSKDVPEQSKESMINTWKEKYNDIPNNYGTINDFIYSANRMNNNGIDATEIDEYATLDKTKDILNKEEYDKWVDDTFNENLINDKGIRNDKDRYTPSGNVRSFKATHNPVNLETLVKALSRGNTKGGQEMSIFGTGFGRISAQTANRFNSIKDIKTNENRLMSREEASKIIEPLANKLYADTEELAKYYNPREYKSDIVANMQAMDNTSQVIEEFASKNLTSDNLKKTLSDWGYNTYNIDKIPQSVIDNIIDDLNQAKQLPTDYFEAKPQRAVGLDEIAVLVIPNDAKESTRQSIIDKGLDFVEYDPSIEGDRQRVINQFDNLKFSISNKNEDIAPIGNYRIKGEDIKLQDIAPIEMSKANQKVETKQNLPIEPTKEEAYENKKTRSKVREELSEKMNINTDDLEVGKDISSLNYQITDPIRVNEKVFGAEVGKKINDATVRKTNHNEAERTRFLNKEREEIANLGIKARSKESAAVQKYGEKQYVTDKGEVKPYTDVDLALEFKDKATQEKIKNAARVLRNKYDTYIEDINKVITQMGYDPIPKRPDYMRHFQEINDKLSQWGIPLNPNDMSKDTLPTDINGITDQFKPGKNWFASAMQRKGLKTTYDAITGIDGYLEGASNLIYHTADIQRYRTLSKMIRDTYGQTHGLDNVDLDTKEGQQRLNNIFDNKLSKYAAWLDEQANSLAGKKGGIDRAAERLLGRKIYTIADTAKKQVGSNMTGFNVRSALTNFASAVQGASKTNKLAFIKGTVSTINNMIHNDGLIDKSDFLTNRFGSNTLSKKLWQKLSNAGQIFMTGTDYFTANQIWRSKYYENLSKGMNETEAIKAADDFASRIMGDRSKGMTAEAFNSKTLGLLTQFQLEVNNQWQSMIHDNKMDIKTGNKSGATVMFQLGQLAAMSYLFNNFMKSMTGSDVMFDPIDILKELLGYNDDDDEETSLEERSEKVLSNIVNNLPFASLMTGGRIPISEAFTGIGTGFQKLTGQKDKYGNDITWDDVKDDVITSAFYWLLPTGYGQVKKTQKGLSMYDESLPLPGSYTNSGNLRFTADDTTGAKIQAALFGEYSSEEAQKYRDSGYQTINASDVDLLKKLNMNSSEFRKFENKMDEATETSMKKDGKTYTKYFDANDNEYWYDKESRKLYDSNFNESSKNVLDLKKASNNELLFDFISNSYFNEKQKQELFNKYFTNTTTDKYGYEKYTDSKGKTYWYNKDKNILYDSKYNIVVDKNVKNLTKVKTEKNLTNYKDYGSYEEADYAIKNPEKYTASKLITNSFSNYKKYLEDISNIESDKNVYGKAIANSKKNKVVKYINGLNESYGSKILLYKMYYPSDNSYNNDIVNYLNKSNISLDEEKKLLTHLGMTISSDGTVRWNK